MKLIKYSNIYPQKKSTLMLHIRSGGPHQPPWRPWLAAKEEVRIPFSFLLASPEAAQSENTTPWIKESQSCCLLI